MMILAPLTPTDADALARAGAAWLDEHAPADWRERVDEERLSMEEGCMCVCGQVFQEAALDARAMSGYAYAIDLAGHWSRDEAYVTDKGEWAAAHGFIPPLRDPDDESFYAYQDREAVDWRALERAWRRLLWGAS